MSRGLPLVKGCGSTIQADREIELECCYLLEIIWCTQEFKTLDVRLDKITGFDSWIQKSNVQLKLWRISDMYREMMKPRYKGQELEISLTRWGYRNYSAECSYYFDKREGKYSLSMWIKRNDIEDRMKISSKKIDTQYISCRKEEIVEGICKIVYHMSACGDKNGERYLDRFAERYEYELMCFERGNELFEKERLADGSDEE